MKEQIIKSILSTKLINISELVRRINKKGLSVPSMYNKINPCHRHKFKNEELADIESQLKNLAKDILKKLGD